MRKRMKVVRWLSILTVLTLPHCSFSELQQISASDAISTNLCELAEHPQQFSGKLVSVLATVTGKDILIDDFDGAPCSAYLMIVAVYPDAVKPPPGFEFQHDDSSAFFDKEVRTGKNVEATFIGRFDVSYVWQNHVRVKVGKERGYGPKDQYGARIVLHRIANVTSRPRPRK